MTAPVLVVGGRAVVDGEIVQLDETSSLDFVIAHQGSIPELVLADEQVPLVHVGEVYRSAAGWVDEQRTQHFVGDCPVSLDLGEMQLHAVLRRLPTRISLDDYHFLVHFIRTRLGAAAVEDPLGRVRIWAQLAPRIPAAAEERARVLVAMFGRSAPAIRRIAVAPQRSLASVSEWQPIHRAMRSRGRIDGRRIRRSDPPRPIDRPVEGVVLVVIPDESMVTPENQYVRSVVGLLMSSLLDAQSNELPDDVVAGVANALESLESWFADPEWRSVRPGPVPQHSFALSDHPDYAVVSSLGVQLDRLPGLLARFPPSDVEQLFPLNTYSLNALYERWIQVLVFDWIVSRLGAPARPFAAAGSWQWNKDQRRVVLRLDTPYPRTASHGIVVPVGKNRPDVAIEVWNGDAVEVLVLDPTYSQSPMVHNEKLQYGANLRLAGARHPLTNDAPLVVRWASYARPSHVVAVRELAAELGRADLSLPPRLESAELLARFLDATVGTQLTL